jgi:hypothetical protein
MEPIVINMPYMIASPEHAKSLIDTASPRPLQWVILDWRDCVMTTKGFVRSIETFIYDLGARPAHAHPPPIKERVDGV